MKPIVPFLARLCLILAGLLVLATSQAFAANPFVHQLFTSNMVLQRDAEDPIWGWTTPGNTVTVTVFDENAAAIQTRTATADSSGRWQTTVGPFGLVAGHAPYSLSISAPGETTAQLTNVLIGDVFLCSGQSNMEYIISGSVRAINVYNKEAEIADSANYPLVRHFTVARTSALTPQLTIEQADWKVSGTATTAEFSATGYFMARELHKRLGIPIGVIKAAYGGTYIQFWLPSEFIASFGDFAVDKLMRSPTDDFYSGAYNQMIFPIASFNFRAVAWYQGEANHLEPEQYKSLLPGMMSCWRTLFNKPNLPFLIVQLANTISYAGSREAQMQTVQADPNSRLVVIHDTSENYLHPYDKQDVGLRAAYAALDLVYGQDGPVGPLFTGATVSGSTIRCSFSNVGPGLMVGLKTVQQTGTQTPVQELVSGTLNCFRVAGADKKFYTAKAVIDPADNTVIVSSPSVPAPLYVHYGWEDSAATANLYRKVIDSGGNVIDGVPASSFRNEGVPVLSVNDGSGSGSYAFDSQVTVTGSSFPNQAFDHWGGDTQSLSGTSSLSTTATVNQWYTSLIAVRQVTNPPSNFSATPGIGQITLNWDAMQGVRYNLKRSLTPGGPYTVVDLSGTTSYIDSGLAQGTTVYYKISATGLMGEGPESSELAQQPWQVVQSVQVTPGPAQIGLSWSAPVGNVLSYNVKRATVSGGPYTTIASGLNSQGYTDRAVVTGGTYYYAVTAITDRGETPNSSEAKGVASFLPAPFQEAEIGTVGVAGSSYCPTLDSYTVIGSGTGVSAAGDSMHFAYYPTQVSGNFTFTAHLTDVGTTTAGPEVGIMARSNLTGTSTFVRSYVNATKTLWQGRNTLNFGIGTSGSTRTLRWMRIVRSGDICSGYFSADGSTWVQQGGTVRLAGSVYLGFEVASLNNSTNNWASFDNVSLVGGTWTFQAPDAPTGMKAVRSGSTALLSWNAAAGAQAYNLKESTAPGGPYTPLASGTNTVSYSLAGITSGTTRYYVVSGTNVAGEGTNSAEFALDLETPVINSLSDISAAATGPTGAVVNFTPVVNDDVDGSLQATCTPPSGSLFPLGTTAVNVLATDAAGNSTTSSFNVVVNLPAPSNLTATLLSDTQLRLDWTNNAPFASAYVIQRSLRGLDSWVTLTNSLPPGSTSYVDNTLSAGTQYDYRIQCTGSGASSAHVPVKAATPDSIGDGIPGWWRYQHFGNGLTVTPASAAHADPDGDGISNLHEFLADTDPVDPGSYFRMTQVRRNGSDLVVQFSTKVGKTYRLEKSPVLGPSAVWTPVLDDAVGTGANVSGTDTGAAGQTRQFYRAVVK